MSKSLPRFSAQTIFALGLFILNIFILTLSVISGIIWLCALSVTVSLVFLSLYGLVRQVLHTQSKWTRFLRKNAG